MGEVNRLTWAARGSANNTSYLDEVGRVCVCVCVCAAGRGGRRVSGITAKAHHWPGIARLSQVVVVVVVVAHGRRNSSSSSSSCVV